MNQKLFNSIFSIIKSILFIIWFPLFIIELNKSIDSYLDDPWLYENSVYLVIILGTFYFITIVIEIIFFFVNRFIFFSFHTNKFDVLALLDFTGIIISGLLINDLIKIIKNKSLSASFTANKKYSRSVAYERMSYQDFDTLETNHEKRRALVNALIDNQIQPKEFKTKMEALNFNDV